MNEGGGLDKFDKATGIFHHIDFIERDIMCIENDQNGDLWIGTYYGGFGVMNPETYKYKVFNNNPSDTMSLSSNIVWTFYEDTISNIMYVGTRGGGLNMFEFDEVIEFDEAYFKGKDIYVFDDVVTTGASYAIFANQLEMFGGNVLGGLFLGRTHYKYAK